MKYDAIIVGGGIAGLTSAAFLAKKGYSVLVCEKQKQIGGLVSSFYYDGFLFDAGVRGIVDSGIVKPMLKQLGISVEFVRSVVTIGIEDEFVKVEDLSSLHHYQTMLEHLYPESKPDIEKILAEIRKVMDYMDILYGIENPLFKELAKDPQYLWKTLLPWLVRFGSKVGKINRFHVPVYEFLSQLTKNTSLTDIICQHFFQQTPASFALSYFSLYLDYEYPVKGTSELIYQMRDFIVEKGGEIVTDTEIKQVNPTQRTIVDQQHNTYEYGQLIWAADTNQLYRNLNLQEIQEPQTQNSIVNQRSILLGKKGGDSIYSFFLAVDLDKDFFSQKVSGHSFYTPKKTGQSGAFNRLAEVKHSQDKNLIFAWMKEYLQYTTYEIAIPSLRNEALAPKGKTGLVISVLMDYDFIANIKALGFYEEFKEFSEQTILEVLSESLFKGLNQKVLHRFSSTPLTIEHMSGNHEGGITGWAYTNQPIPAVHSMMQIKYACQTPIPNILQAGQWTFSPSGLPISILTGKLAADEATKRLK